MPFVVPISEVSSVGLPSASILQSSDGRAIEDFVVGQGFATQPNVFDSKRIEDEIRLSASLQPDVNTPEGSSATWQQLYDASALRWMAPQGAPGVEVVPWTDPPPEAEPEFLFDLPELRYPERLNAAVEFTDRMVERGFGQRPPRRAASRKTASSTRASSRLP